MGYWIEIGSRRKSKEIQMFLETDENKLLEHMKHRKCSTRNHAHHSKANKHRQKNRYMICTR